MSSQQWACGLNEANIMNEIPNFPQNSVSFLLFSFCVPLSHTCFKISSCSMCQRQGGGATPENIEHRTDLWSSWWCDVGSIRPSDCMNVCSVVGVGVIVIWLYWRVFIYIGLPVSTRGGESAINISIPGPWFLVPPSTGPYPAHCARTCRHNMVHTGHRCDQDPAC